MFKVLEKHFKSRIRTLKNRQKAILNRMDGDEEDVGWDGPNIRPPPVKQDSGNRNRFGSDRRHHHGSSSHGGKQHHSRSSSHHDRSDRSSSRQDSRQGQSRGREGRESRDRRVPVEDLRGRIGQAKGSGSEYRHGSSSREKERQKNVKRQVNVKCFL